MLIVGKIGKTFRDLMTTSTTTQRSKENLRPFRKTLPSSQKFVNHENDSPFERSSQSKAESPDLKKGSPLHQTSAESQIPENNRLSQEMEFTETKEISPKGSESNTIIEEDQVTNLEKKKINRKSLIKPSWITRRPRVLQTFQSHQQSKQHAYGNVNARSQNRQNIPPPPSYYSPRQENRPPVRNQEPARAQSDHRVHFNRFHTPNTFRQNFINPAYWSFYPISIPANIPPRLAQLVEVDALFVTKNLEILQLLTGLGGTDFFLIHNKYGECLYYGYETFNYLNGSCCSGSRGLQLIFRDIYQNEVIFMSKNCGCNLPCFFCCYPVMEIYAPPSVPIGAVVRVCQSARDDYIILDSNENAMFIIRGSYSGNFFPSCSELQYSIHALDPEKTIVGYIKRQFGDFRTYTLNAEVSGISFPSDIDVRIKSVFLGALMLIETTFFQ